TCSIGGTSCTSWRRRSRKAEVERSLRIIGLLRKAVRENQRSSHRSTPSSPRFRQADLNPGVPAVEEASGGLGVHREQLLQVHADLHRLDRVQVLRFQSRQRLLFLLRQMIDVLQEDVASALDLEVVLRLLTPHFVDGL